MYSIHISISVIMQSDNVSKDARIQIILLFTQKHFQIASWPPCPEL